ncbi:MAG TPA: SRPBCC domain-containing protein [Propionibacteriaceae bacterium]|nr:SRPBCC domain-containing protein [Propionibacteriaceae bacterium]
MMATPGDPNVAATSALAVHQSVHVELPASEAFRLFTDGIGEWWPLPEGYSYGGDRAQSIFLEPVVGGRFFERFVDGDEMQVGTVISCSPPDLIVFTWRSPEWRGDTEVDVRFVPDDAGTSVLLEHRGWEGLGPDGEGIAAQWANGWPRVIAAFARRAAVG